MPKIAFMGAGSTVFAKNVLGDCMLTPSLRDAEIALYDIDKKRLDDSQTMLNNLKRSLASDVRIKAYCGEDQRRDALDRADYVVNAIQVGGYEPATVTDFDIPKKYGLQQTIGDTLGIGGIFRALRTIPVMLDFARDIAEVCPNAWFLNYVNPMAMITKALLGTASVQAVGLCHSVQGCAQALLAPLGIEAKDLRWKIAGINHQAWLLEIMDGDKDLYPEIKAKAADRSANETHGDMVRYEIMKLFGYYVTESSEHSAEYMPYWIKKDYPEQIDRFNIPLDEYPRRCVNQIDKWEKQREDLVNKATITHERTHEYASRIMHAMETDEPFRIHGNVTNTGLITNLPKEAIVEVPCLVDRNGVNPCYVGDLPEQCAAMNRTNINVQLLTVEAALTGKKERVYQAALMDPHTAAELSIDEIVSMCDELIEAHGELLPPLS
ncbi:MAG: alpha-glucosidase/alpha-galactosidase [Candidatus Pacebacteria bacterium]|nr:alpha-glucosidase/alpha-galactosidase [Candidatus Paceibacterota bacterium]